MVDKFKAQIVEIKAKAPGQTTIPVFINSKGGKVKSGLEIVELFKQLEAEGKKVATVCTTHVGSIASFIFVSGSNGQRFASEKCTIFFHELRIAFEKGAKVEASDMMKKATQSHANAMKVYNEVAKKCQKPDKFLCDGAPADNIPAIGLCVCNPSDKECKSGACLNAKACTLKTWGCIDTVWNTGSVPAMSDGMVPSLPMDGTTCTGSEVAAKSKCPRSKEQPDDE